MDGHFPRSLLVLVTVGLATSAIVAIPAADAVHPGDAGHIVFVDLVEAHDQYGSLAPEIFISSHDGSNRQRLTFDGGYPAIQPGASDYELTGSRGPAWTPDGKRIAFVHRGLDRTSSIEVMHSDGSGRRTINAEVSGGDLTWSPDGQHLALFGYSTETQETGVWVMRSDGTDPELILPMSSSSNSGFWALGDLDWSPSGTHLVFGGRQGGVPGKQLYTMQIDGTDVRRLECADNWVEGPSWSPDGDWIVAACGDDLYRLAADGSGYEPLVTWESREHTPVWSPDGLQILFVSNRTGVNALWSYDVATSLTTLLTEFSGSQLDWQPVVRFTDTVGNVFRSDIEWLADAGITRGCNPPKNDRFCPGDPVTRGQMAALLHRALDGIVESIGDPIEFTDDDDSTFFNDIAWLSATGITRGCSATAFCPDKPVTRGQMAAFLVRALGYSEDGGGNLFVDDNESVFETDIDKLATAGVTRGCNPPVNDRFCPGSNVTRGQMAAFLHRALGHILAAG